MNYFFKKTGITLAMAAMTIGLAACNGNKTNEFNDEDAAVVAAQFVDHTVAPTYKALAQKTEQLAEQLATLKLNPTDAGVREACQIFLDARAEWEKSEAFLFGAASDYGVDPHIDSWPLDEDAFATLMNSPEMIRALDAEDGDQVAGDRLGNALLGFHGIEYILFKDGQPKNASAITEKQWIYVAAVAGDLRNRCYQLEVGWIGNEAPESHIEKLDDLEMQYTVAGGNYSYGENMKKAGLAGSTYPTRISALMAIVQGCVDIADEVGSSKIYAAWHGEDVTYIESPYSYMSITDFTNNIISIQNVYMGGADGQRSEAKSLHNYVKGIDGDLDAKVISAINNALEKIQAMPAPFALHYNETINGEAVEACAELSEILDEVIVAMRKQ